MKIKQLLTKASAVLCAALSAGTFLGSLPSLTAEAGTTPFGVSNLFTVQAILNDERQFAKNRVYQAVTDAVDRCENLTSKNYNNFNVFYTTQLEGTNFLVIYDSKDMDLYNAIHTKNGKNWANRYSNYLKTLTNITGVSYDWNVCIFDTKTTNINSQKLGDYNAYFNRGSSLGIFSGVIYNKFTQSLLHETSHEFKTSVSKMLGNAEEEVNVNLRAICALHWMGLDQTKVILTDYDADWGAKDGVDPKYQYTSNSYIKPYSDSAIQKYIPTGSTIKTSNPTFIRISEMQYLAKFGRGDTSSYQLITRLGMHFNYCTDKPVWASACTYNYDDANNWLNTEALETNWNTISTDEWKMLSQLCITDSASIKAYNPSGTYYSIANEYDTYVKSCKTVLSYKYSSTKYKVKVSSNVNKWISENCSSTVVNGERIYNISGNLIQALNCMDRLGVDFYSAMVQNKTNNTSAKDFYLNMLGVNKGRLHAYTLTKV